MQVVVWVGEMDHNKPSHSPLALCMAQYQHPLHRTEI